MHRRDKLFCVSLEGFFDPDDHASVIVALESFGFSGSSAIGIANHTFGGVTSRSIYRGFDAETMRKIVDAFTNLRCKVYFFSLRRSEDGLFEGRALPEGLENEN